MGSMATNKKEWDDETLALTYVGTAGMLLCALIHNAPDIPLQYLVAFALMVLPVVVRKVRAWIRYQNFPKRVLVVLTNSTAGCDDYELVRAMRAFDGAGIQAVLATPLGGKAPLDASNYLAAQAEQTVPLARCPASDFLGLYVVGGPGAREDLADCAVLQERVAQIAKSGGALGGCGGGVEALGAARREALVQVRANESQKQLEKRVRLESEKGGVSAASWLPGAWGDGADCAAVVAQVMCAAMHRAAKAEHARQLAKAGKAQ